MKIDVIKKTEYSDLSSVCSCEIKCIHIKISDYKPIIKEFEKQITDTSSLKLSNTQKT